MKKINFLFFVLFILLTFPIVIGADQTVTNLDNDSCQIETMKTFSLTELPNDFVLKTVAINKLGRVFIGAQSDWNNGVILFTATAYAGPTSWNKVNLLNGKIATVRSISTNPDKDGEAIAEIHTYATEDMSYLFYTYNNGLNWTQAKSPDNSSPGLRRTIFVKYDTGFDPLILSINVSNNKIYNWTGTPPMMSFSEYTTIPLLDNIYRLVSFKDGNVFAIGRKTDNQSGIFRATTSNLKNWEETTVPAGFSIPDNIARAPDGGFLAFIRYNSNDANIWKSSDGKVWSNLSKGIHVNKDSMSVAETVVSTKSGVIAVYVSGDVYRFKSTQGNATLSNMFGIVPFSNETYKLRALAASPAGYFVNVTGREIRNLKCNSQPSVNQSFSSGKINELVTLDTHASDIENDTLNFSWVQTEGTQVTLSSSNVSTPTFTPTTVGTFKFNVTISDNASPAVNPLVVSHTVNIIQNDSPTVTVENNKTCEINQLCTITSIANDPDGNPIMYFWTKESGPEIDFENSFTNTLSVTPIEEGVYVFKIEVTDSMGPSNYDTITITVTNEASDSEEFSVNAGNDKTCVINTPCTLTGIVTPGELPVIRAEWVKISGPTVSIEDNYLESITFTPVNTGVYVMEFSAHTSSNESTIDMMTLTVVEENDNATSEVDEPVNTNVDDTEENQEGVNNPNPLNNQSPLLEVSANVSGEINSPVIINTLAIDPEQDLITIEWEQTAGPDVNFMNDSGTLIFVPTKSGEYVFVARALDSNGNYSQPRIVNVTIDSLGEFENYVVPKEITDFVNTMIMLGVGIIVLIIVIVVSLIVTKEKKKSSKRK